MAADPAGAEALSARLLGFFLARGYDRTEPGMLLPADIVLDHMGEDIRRRLLVTVAPDGTEYCLRPDFTLPVALRHLAAGGAGAARYAYGGLAFRFPAGAQASGASPEFRQVGVEDYGAADPLSADAETVLAANESLAEVGFRGGDLLIGDVGLFAAMLDALAVPAAWRSRLMRRFWRHAAAGDVLAGIEAAAPDGRNAAALGDIDEAAARALVEEMMAVAGIARAGARTASEIARRFVAKASGGHAGLDAAALRTLSAYLAIAGPARAALDQVAGLAREAGLDLDSALEGLNGRFELLSVGGIDLDAARFATEFGRRIEYYTGLVFEIRDPAGPAAGQIAGGGRYDRFLADLGAESRIAAVGCSIYVDRLAAALGRGG